MVYTYTLDGLFLQSGDLICTNDGGRAVVAGEFWRMVGKLLPGDVDHVAVYVGPGGRCVEAGPKGVYAYEIEGNTWDGDKMLAQRLFVDTLYGVAYPLQGRGLAEPAEPAIRADVAAYCLAQVGKSYNLNFFDSRTEQAFYCSQLAYVAYLRHGIDLNTEIGIPSLPASASIVFPQEIWNSVPHVLCPGRQ
ncbi:MAG: hypothetical protein JW850_10580 [Thermoflexales bacterium]|nr:hypothetical protein [Thermoflexales bacterium]